jgi:hypothetical protein
MENNKNLKKEDGEIKFIDTKEKKFIGTNETTKKVLEYIDECSQNSLKREEKIDKN